MSPSLLCGETKSFAQTDSCMLFGERKVQRLKPTTIKRGNNHMKHLKNL